MSKDIGWGDAVARSSALEQTKTKPDPKGPWTTLFAIVRNGSHGCNFPGRAAFVVVARGPHNFDFRRPIGFGTTEEDAMLLAETKYREQHAYVADFFKKEPMPKKGGF